MIRCARPADALAGLAFIPLQMPITVASPRSRACLPPVRSALPLFATGTVVALGCVMTLRIYSNAIYWADILLAILAILLLQLGMGLAITPSTTLRRVRSRRNRRRIPLRHRPARRRPAARRSSAVLRIPRCDGSHRGAITALACVLATLATFIIERLPVDLIPRDYPFGVRNQQAAKPVKTMKKEDQPIDRRRNP
jgi:hypothetical protein